MMKGRVVFNILNDIINLRIDFIVVVYLYVYIDIYDISNISIV